MIHLRWFYLLSSLLSSLLLVARNDNPENSDWRDDVLSMYHIVDVQYSEEVHEYIELYTSKYRHIYGRMLGRSELYFPIIDQYTAKHGLPYELRYLAAVESNMKPYAISRSKAVGLWQIMELVGRYYHLRIDKEVDERMDPYKSTDVAMSYLKSLHDQFEDWTLAIAAYNCGPGRMRRAIKESGSRNFWDLQSYLPLETQRYIPKFIAFNYLFQYAHKYDLEKEYPISIEDLSYEYTIVHGSMSFEEIVEFSGVDHETIKYLNPSYQLNRIPANSEGYLLILPGWGLDNFLEYHIQEGSINLLKDVVPRYHVIPRYKVQQSGHTVRSGDNLYDLARKFDCTVAELKQWNHLNSHRIYPGQRLSVNCRAIDPKPFTRNAQNLNCVPEIEFSMVHIPEKTESSLTLLAASNSELRPKNAYRLYRLNKRESVQEIANRFPGVQVTDIMRLNGLDEDNIPKPGMILKIGSF
jgi:membrane-bound lytic murein transglycosylase D